MRLVGHVKPHGTCGRSKTKKMDIILGIFDYVQRVEFTRHTDKIILDYHFPQTSQYLPFCPTVSSINISSFALYFWQTSSLPTPSPDLSPFPSPILCQTNIRSNCTNATFNTRVHVRSFISINTVLTSPLCFPTDFRLVSLPSKVAALSLFLTLSNDTKSIPPNMSQH